MAAATAAAGARRAARAARQTEAAGGSRPSERRGGWAAGGNPLPTVVGGQRAPPQSGAQSWTGGSFGQPLPPAGGTHGQPPKFSPPVPPPAGASSGAPPPAPAGGGGDGAPQPGGGWDGAAPPAPAGGYWNGPMPPQQQNEPPPLPNGSGLSDYDRSRLGVTNVQSWDSFGGGGPRYHYGILAEGYAPTGSAAAAGVARRPVTIATPDGREVTDLRQFTPAAASPHTCPPTAAAAAAPPAEGGAPAGGAAAAASAEPPRAAAPVELVEDERSAKEKGRWAELTPAEWAAARSARVRREAVEHGRGARAVHAPVVAAEPGGGGRCHRPRLHEG